MEINYKDLLLKYYTAGALYDATMALCPDPNQEITLEMLTKILILAKKLDQEGHKNVQLV